MKNNLFSIIIPVYNTEKFVAETINSILMQKYKKVEIICINDGSTDNSLHILKQIQMKDNRIKVIDIKNGGPSNARNTGIRNATGDYIMFLDSDDLLEPKCLKMINKKICDNNYPNLLNFSLSLFNSDDIPAWIERAVKSRTCIRSGEECFASLFEEPSATPFSTNKVYKTSFIKSNNLFFPTHIKLGEDSAFLFKVFSCLDTAYFFSDVIYNYRWQRQDSLMTTFKKNTLNTTKSHLLVVEEIFKTLHANNKLHIRTDQTMQFVVNLLFNSHLKELNKKDAMEISQKFLEFLQYYDKSIKLHNLYNLELWDNINVSDYSSIKFIESCKKNHTIDFVVYENATFNLDNLYQFLEKQKNLDYRIIINCFSFKFYEFIKSLNIKNSVVIILPSQSFSYPKNLILKYSSSKYVLYLNHLNHLNTNICLDEMIDTLNKNLSYVALTMNPKANKKLVKQDDNCELLDLGSTIFRTSKLQDFEDFKEDTPCCDSIFMLENLAHKKVLVYKISTYNTDRKPNENIISSIKEYTQKELITSLGKLSISALKNKFHDTCKDIIEIIKTNNIVQTDNPKNPDYYYSIIYLYPLVKYMSKYDPTLIYYVEFLNSLTEQLEAEYEFFADNIDKLTLQAKLCSKK